jgi:hypothetical protein
MHKYNFRDLLKWTDIYIAGPFPWGNQGNRYLQTTMDYFTKWPEAYAIPNQEDSTVAEALVTNFLCHFGVPWDLQSDQVGHFKSHMIQEVLQHSE